MKAEDILPDRQDRIRLGGVEIRKGSVGAFIANARLLLEEELPAAQRRQAEDQRDRERGLGQPVAQAVR
ncbi:hypothetical protein [Pseudomonas aeruginosa]|uniref:hypothetical protein n=1 Tax=Pseudomonas aeruginosa TaxID=287 RepID=UPI003969A0AB